MELEKETASEKYDKYSFNNNTVLFDSENIKIISDIYQEYFNDHQYFFEIYIKQSSIEKNDTKVANWRLSYINYLTDVRKSINNI